MPDDLECDDAALAAWCADVDAAVESGVDPFLAMVEADARHRPLLT